MLNLFPTARGGEELQAVAEDGVRNEGIWVRSEGVDIWVL
jgi:hypothetical protein